MSCDLEIVAYKSGFFGLDVPDRYIHGTYDYHRNSFKALMDRALNEQRGPREWVLENATICKFQDSWKDFIGERDETTS
jgi:hypothetical protein